MPEASKNTASGATPELRLTFKASCCPPAEATVVFVVGQEPATDAGAKVALTLLDALKVNVQAAVPVQAPLQPMKVVPVAGVAINVTFEPTANGAEQLLVQLMPEGVEVTVPEPVTATLSVAGLTAKVTDTVLAASIVTVQVVVVPLQAPLHPAKVKPVDGAATKVTVLPLLKVLLQLEAQELPSEKPTPPVPEMVRFNARVTTAAEKVADTFLASLIVTVQVEDVPAQAPPQPAKVNPAAGAAAKVMVLPLLKVLAQLAEHELPSEKPTPPVPVIVRLKPNGAGVVALGLK